MSHLIKKFADDEFGSTVLDWTIFGAGIASMAVVIVATIATL